MTVRDNVAFGLTIRKRPKDQIQAKVDELLELVGLAGFHGRYPSQLSGGQRQRMALARALAIEPRVLLLDEPFGALDANVRADLRTWLRRLHDEVHVTTVLVTHDQEEAMEVASNLVVLRDGKIEQTGAPRDIYEQPANAFVMGFIGPVSELDGKLVRPHDLMLVRRAGGRRRGGDGRARRRTSASRCASSSCAAAASRSRPSSRRPRPTRSSCARARSCGCARPRRRPSSA